MNIKQLLGAQAHWNINKELARQIGLYPTVLLQHLIDLDDSFFKDMQGGFYQQQHRLVAAIPMSESQLRKSTTELINLGLITATRKGVPPKYFYTIEYDNLYKFINVTFKGSLFERLESEQERLRIKVSKEDKELNKTNIDDDFFGKIFFKIVDAYPANRIGNRQHGLKAFKNLDKEEAKLAAVNLKRYLATASEPRYVKTLINYINEKCFTEEWLGAQEKQSKKSDTKTFNTNYGNF